MLTKTTILIITFLPNSDAMNASLRKQFLTKQKPDCYVSVHAVCQEGEKPLKTYVVDLDQGS